MKHTTPESRDPAELRPHSILAHIPAPAKDGPEVCACADAIREQDGHLLPLVIDETNQILTDDSRLRWMAAKRMGMDDVPVVVQPGALAPVIALNAITHRAHYSLGARAYIAIPLLKPALDAARAVRVEYIKKHGKPPELPFVQSLDERAKSVEQLAAAHGFSRSTLFEARKVREAFEADQKTYPWTIEGGERDGEEVELTLRDWFEPQLFRDFKGGEHKQNRPIGLGAIIAGIASKRTTGGQPKIIREQLELFAEALSNSVRFLRYWPELSAQKKREGRAKLRAWLDSLPEELRAEIVAIAEEAQGGAK